MVDEAWVCELERRAAPLRVALPPWGEVLARETWHVPTRDRASVSQRWVIAAIAFAAAACIGLVWWDGRESSAVPSVVVQIPDDRIDDPIAPVAAPVPVSNLAIELGPPPPPPPSPPTAAPPRTSPPKTPTTRRRSPPATPPPTVDCVLDPALCPKPPTPPKLPVDLPESLTITEVKVGIAPVRRDVQRCGERHGMAAGMRVNVKLAIAGETGRVREASIESPTGLDAALSSCVLAAVKRAQFPRFRKLSMGAVIPFTL